MDVMSVVFYHFEGKWLWLTVCPTGHHNILFSGL